MVARDPRLTASPDSSEPKWDDGARQAAPLGHATYVGLMPDAKGAVVAWRLTIGKAPLPGRWVCVGREFIPAEAWGARGGVEVTSPHVHQLQSELLRP